MALLGVALLLFCAVSFSLLDVLRKKLSAMYSPFRILTLLMGAQIPLYAIWYAFDNQATDYVHYGRWGVYTALLNFTANLLIVGSLKLAPLSNAVPLLALSPIFSLLMQPFFDLPIRNMQIMGAALVFIGATVLNGIPHLRSEKDRGLVLMIAAAFCCGMLVLFDKQSLNYASIPYHGLFQTVGITALGLVAERLFKTPAHEMKMSLTDAPKKLWLGASVAAFAAGISQLSALSYFEPGVVESVKRALVLFLSLSFGFLFFKEKLTQRKIFGVFIISLGIILCTKK